MIYKFKGSIPGSKVFMREYEIEGSSTLYDFNDFLTNDLGFSPGQMTLFRGMDRFGEPRSEYGLFDMGDGAMDEVTVEKVIKRGEKELHYVFDMNRQRYIRLDFMETCSQLPRVSYPRLVAEKGRNPEQFAKGYEDFDQISEPFENMEGSAIEESELPENEESI